MASLEAKYYNDTGFNYMAFLADLVPPPLPRFMYLERLKNLREVNANKNLKEIDPSSDLEQLLLKMKTKVRVSGADNSNNHTSLLVIDRSLGGDNSSNWSAGDRSSGVKLYRQREICILSCKKWR